MTTSDSLSSQQPAKRSGLLFFLWNNLPRVALVLCIVGIWMLFVTVSEKKSQLEAAKQEEHVEQKKLINTVLLELHPRTVQDVIHLPGSVEAWFQLALLSKISGAVTEVVVEEGDSVKAGDVIARIEEDDYRIALAAAKAAYTQAKSDFARNQTMLRKKVIPPASLEASKTTLLRAKADLEKAELNLKRCKIITPIDSVVRRLNAKVGGYLGVGDPVGELLQLDQVKGVVGIPESDVDAVRKIDQVQITISALDNRQCMGKAHFLSPAPETTAYLYRFELALDNPEHRILPGMFLRAHIVKETIENALMVPLYAIISRGGNQYVCVVKGDTVRMQQVELGIIEQWEVQVTRGVAPGDTIVIEGHRDVDDGQQVNVVKIVTDPAERLL
ncbi:MAG: hypothetical protein CSA26_10915 [Desulfobacterales bacterium]|nr:MAG: hypothetical protein CSA26_10915 [Desulfobacterales bacterium]